MKMEPMLMDDDGTLRSAPKDNRLKWAGYIALSLIFVCATIGTVMYFEHKNGASSPVNFAEETAHICDACDAIPGFDEYQNCKSCWFKAEEDKELSCNVGYGDLKITRVKHASGKDLAMIATECAMQEDEFDFSTGEPFVCNINLAELRMEDMADDAQGEEEYVDYSGAEGPEPVVDDAAEPTPALKQEWRPIGSEGFPWDPIDKGFGWVEAPDFPFGPEGPFAAKPDGPWGPEDRPERPPRGPPGPHGPHGPHDHHGHHHHHKGELKIEYICSKQDVDEPETPEAVPAFQLRSTHRVERFTDEPLLSSALVKCDKRKTLADTVQVGKACGADTWSLSCDENGVDARIVVLKFKEEGAAHSKQNKKAGKARAKMVTNKCVGSGATCDFEVADFMTESETAADFAGKVFNVKYLCSYGEALSVETPALADPHACCKALTPQCMSCVEGITEAEYCSREENAEICGSQQLLRSPRYEAPSDLLLESALVHCGGTKAMANTVDIGKVCDDSTFDLTCDATRTGARVVVLKFKDTTAEKPTAKADKKERKKAMKSRAAAATNLCDSQRDSGSCSFALEDVLEEGVDMASLTDHVFNVKYLCSYDA